MINAVFTPNEWDNVQHLIARNMMLHTDGYKFIGWPDADGLVTLSVPSDGTFVVSRVSIEVPQTADVSRVVFWEELEREVFSISPDTESKRLNPFGSDPYDVGEILRRAEHRWVQERTTVAEMPANMLGTERRSWKIPVRMGFGCRFIGKNRDYSCVVFEGLLIHAVWKHAPG